MVNPVATLNSLKLGTLSVLALVAGMLFSVGNYFCALDPDKRGKDDALGATLKAIGSGLVSLSNANGVISIRSAVATIRDSIAAFLYDCESDASVITIPAAYLSPLKLAAGVVQGIGFVVKQQDADNGGFDDALGIALVAIGNGLAIVGTSNAVGIQNGLQIIRDSLTTFLDNTQDYLTGADSLPAGYRL